MALRERMRQTKSSGRSAPPAGEGSGPQRADVSGSRARRVGFRVLAVVTSLWLLALMVFGLTEVVLMWLPADTLTAFLGEDAPADLEAHRSHYMSIGIAAWALVLAVAVQVRRPHRREAAMVWAVALAVAGAVVFALHGPVGEWLLADVTVVVVVLALAALHPRARDLVRRPDRDRRMAVLAVVAAIPWLVFAGLQVRHQWHDVTGDIHAEPEHWAVAALMALAILAAAVIGSGDRTGWRLPAWFAVAASVGYGAHSLVFASAVSALPTGWALAAIVWGAAYGVAIIRRSRLAPSLP